MRYADRPESSRDIAAMTLVIGALAGVIVPQSHPKAGLTPVERELVFSVLPLLLAAFSIALLAAGVSLAGGAVVGRRMSLGSLVLINIAGLFSGRYGVEGAGLLATLLVTSPLMLVFARRAIRLRRNSQEETPE
jgi:hypothetical protein